MPVNSGLTMTVASGAPLFRITSLSFYTTNPADHIKVVNGQGAKLSRFGARYNYPAAVTVYLTEDLDTCLAEKMFYFHREIMRGIDEHHRTGVIPPFQQKFVLWEVKLNQAVPDVFDMCIAGAPSYFNIFPSLTVNPSQDYEHLKDRRAGIQSNGYQGLRVQSSRAKGGGNLIVLFDDQSNNVQSITPHDVEFRLITSGGTLFVNHVMDLLDFTAGEVIINSNPLPPGGIVYQNWAKVDFNH